jgi:hypothetical protein
LITEEEVVSAVLHAHPFGRVEKFIQEVYWRRYWKSWLALRPQVWSDFCGTRAALGHDPRAARIENAQSGNAVIDHFAHELVRTGYLHNHARMWFAAWWVHEARLPWQSGAAFFFRHLLDGDPASNTLSWRWVAGWQTPGKTYLARRTNLEKYLAPELLDSLAAGLRDFESPRALQPPSWRQQPVTPRDASPESLTPGAATGLWVHEEDLSVESSPLGLASFTSVLVTGDAATWDGYEFPLAKQQWMAAALRDAATRAELRWKVSAPIELREPQNVALVRWAQAKGLAQVAALRPEIGPLRDSLDLVRSNLAQAGVRLVLIDRPEDVKIRSWATGGFFPFWARARENFLPNPAEPLQLSMDFSA